MGRIYLTLGPTYTASGNTPQLANETRDEYAEQGSSLAALYSALAIGGNAAGSGDEDADIDDNNNNDEKEAHDSDEDESEKESGIDDSASLSSDSSTDDAPPTRQRGQCRFAQVERFVQILTVPPTEKPRRGARGSWYPYENQAVSRIAIQPVLKPVLSSGTTLL